MNYYNENDPSAAAWIMELMKAGAVPDGHLDTRSIVDVQPEDLRGFDQCHFFGGILGWPLALQLSGYQNVKGLWTGSCPCQPFSAAGKRKGTSDARHLWPEMFRLVRACKPQYVLGEQVEAAIRPGWLDGVFGDLEAEGYTTGAVVLGAHSVGAPHIRQRLYWGGARLAEPNAGRERLESRSRDEICGRGARESRAGLGWSGADGGGPGNTNSPTSNRRDERRPEPSGRGATVRCGEGSGRVEHATSEQVGIPGQPREQRDADGLAEPQRNAGEPGRITDESREGDGTTGAWTPVEPGRCGDIGSGCRLGDPDDPRPQGHREPGERPSQLSPWSQSITIPCADGKTRRISPEPGVFPLAHGVPGRVGLLRGYGNAIVPQVAAEFITSFMESITCSQ